VIIEPQRVGAHGEDVLGLVLGHAQDRPAHPAVRDDNESLSYAELYERVAATAAGLSSLGVNAGDRIALYLDNSAVFVTTALACLWVGAPFVPLSVADPPSRVATILQDCDPALVVARDGAEGPSSVPPWAGPAGALRTVTPGALLGAAGRAPQRHVDFDQDAYFIYTSGTTGFPKGVRVQQRAFRLAVVNAAERQGLGPATRVLCVSPRSISTAPTVSFSLPWWPAAASSYPPATSFFS
jgi:acyl-CoA synthetase (AMP-forming)/AMP-acid ligase II